MQRFLIITLVVISAISCSSNNYKAVKPDYRQLDSLVNNWHNAAATANIKDFFGFIHPQGFYIGTAKEEKWGYDQFYSFCKPFFDRGRAWDFKPLKREWDCSEDGKTVWFDELLDTWMGTCRSSGVVVNENNVWKLKHYQLSVTVPNEIIKDFISLVKNFEKPDSTIQK